MSTVQVLLARCRELDAELTPTPHGTLKVKAPAPLPDTLKEELKQRKAEVLALLTMPENRILMLGSAGIVDDKSRLRTWTIPLMGNVP
jgi:hypothetical protein